MLPTPFFKNSHTPILRLLMPIIIATILLAAMQTSFASNQASLAHTFEPSITDSFPPSNMAPTMALTLPITITETFKLTVSDATPGDEFGLSVAIDGDTIVVGARKDDENAIDAGAAYIYERQGIVWVQIKKLLASDGSFNDRFGRDVDIDGDTVVIGAQYDNVGATDSGSVYIFDRNQGGANNWGEVKKITASDPQHEAHFGVRLALQGDQLLVSAPAHSSSPHHGAGYLFERNQGGSNNWGQVKKFVGSDSNAADAFAVGVEIDGDTIILGARLHDSAGNNAGAAYIFERNHGGPDNWGEVVKITASDPATDAEFGKEVAIEGDVVVIGAPHKNELGASSGAVYIFERHAGGPNNWGEVDKLVPGNGAAGDSFGWSVLLHNNNLIIGAPESYNGQTGGAYLYQYQAGQWLELIRLQASDGASNDSFGQWAGMLQNIVIVGARRDDDACPTNPNCDSGSAYVFHLPILTLDKIVTPQLVEPGEFITYTIRFNNYYTVPVSGAILTDIVPAEISNVSYVNSGIAITPTGGVSYTWQVGDMPPGDGGIITITGQVDSSLSSEVLITNTAVLTATNLDTGPLTAAAVLEVNIAPELDITRFYEINEGQSISLTGIITDPGASDSFILQVDWGDGLTETIPYPPGTTSFTHLHPYADDNPSGTPVDDYPIHLTLFDSDGASSQKLAFATVHNISPTVAITAPLSVIPGQTITFSGTVTDPGLEDTFTYLWNLGDGSLISHTLNPTHQYSQTGGYTVTLIITDDDTHTGQDLFLLTVREPKSNLAIHKSVTPSQLLPGDFLTYTLSFSNQGPDPASNVYISDTIPLSLTNLSYSSSGPALIEIGSSPYSWLIDELVAGQSGLITITGQLTTNIPQETSLWNSVVITSTSQDITPSNNSSSVLVDINIAPSLQVDGPYSLVEGDTLSLTGHLSDSADAMNLQINWGDGLTETAVYPTGSFPFSLTHTYADDNPTGTPTDTYTITLHLSDSDGATNSQTAHVTVHNVAPTIQISAIQTITHSSLPLTFSSTITDPGLEDTFTYSWDFGDGTTITSTATVSHTYSTPGSYTLTLTVSDDDTGIGQDSLRLQVLPQTIYLPYVAHNSCQTQFDPVDVVLALDASDSMAAPTEPGGATKFAAAQAAAISFLQLLPFPDSQAAVVSFNGTAILDQPLTSDLASLTAAIQNLSLDTLTRLDLALALGHSELLSPRHMPTHERVIILLTDGVPAGVTEAEVLAEAEATKSVGIVIYTIGLGQNVNADLLGTVASSPDHFLSAPSTSDLDDIYSQIANVILCQE